MEDTIRIPAAHLAQIAGLYDTIGHADAVYMACQGTAFRRVVTGAKVDAAKAFAALTKPAKKAGAPEILQKDARLLMEFGKALDTADAVYAEDNDGNLNYRTYVHGVYTAPVNAALMARIRQALVSDAPVNTQTSTND